MVKTKQSILHFIKLSQTSDWNIKQIVSQVFFNSKYDKISIGKCIRRIKNEVVVQDDTLYKRLTIKTKGGGVSVRDELIGKGIKTKNQYLVSSGQLAVSKIDARNGAFGIVPPEADNAIITGNFWVFEVDKNIVFPQFLVILLSSVQFVQAWLECSNGSGNRLYLQEERFLKYKIPLPSLNEQQALLDVYNFSMQKVADAENKAKTVSYEIERFLFESLGIANRELVKNHSIIHYVSFKDINRWGYDKISMIFPYVFIKYKAYSFNDRPMWLKALVRGKSPQYSADSVSIILNQKCNRTDSIDLSYAKTVDTEWLEMFDKRYLTKESDILINSTGEGTLGRASLVTKEHEGLAYDSHMLLLRVNQEEVDPQLIVDLINSPFGQKQVEVNKSAQATKQTELGVDNTKRILFPLPDLSEQKRISFVVKEKKNKISALQKSAENLRMQAKKEFEEAVFGEI
ncbi:MAG: restriction endonuclease subunit S [Clostridia bacterium]|nr:restriction endonuclease subunit S [Clostridia bacterium]